MRRVEVAPSVPGASESEVSQRRRVQNELLLYRQDFPALVEYNDFLEVREDIIFSLASRTGVAEATAKLEDYKSKFKDQISRNQTEKAASLRKQVAEEKAREKEREREALAASRASAMALSNANLASSAAATSTASVGAGATVMMPSSASSSNLAAERKPEAATNAPKQLAPQLPRKLDAETEKVAERARQVSRQDLNRRVWAAGGYRTDLVVRASRRIVEREGFFR
eukprot:ANDGO_05338.mRNA.1 hypothetical protein